MKRMTSRQRRVISNSAAGITQLRPASSSQKLQIMINRNSAKTAYILSTFLVLSFCLQFVLLSSLFDNELPVVQMITSMTNELVTDMELLDEEMVNALNAAYEYNNNNDNDNIDSEGTTTLDNHPPTIRDFCGTCQFRNQDFNCNHRIQWVMKHKHKTEEEAKLADLQYCLEGKKKEEKDRLVASLLKRNDWILQKKKPKHATTALKFDKTANYSMDPSQILKRAGIDHTEGFIPSITVLQARKAIRQNIEIEKQEAQLPSLEEIQSLYGTRPYIVGLERCQAFRDAVDPEHRLMGPAGLFNTATNLLSRLLSMNCVNTARLKTKKYGHKEAPTGVKIQAPWGKHNPVFWRLHHEAKVGGKGTKQEDFLPVVMVKDPLTWMASMCRHPYEARWPHTANHCPNLVANNFDRGRKPGEIIPVFVKFATKHFGDEPLPDPKNKTFVKYDSLVELWNRWYTEWKEAEFPRLMVRFEDLLFHAEETIFQICDCAGGTMRSRFRYEEDSAKGDHGPHAGSAGFLASLVTYGNSTKRMVDVLKDEADYQFAKENLDETLMKEFGYAPL